MSDYPPEPDQPNQPDQPTDPTDPTAPGEAPQDPQEPTAGPEATVEADDRAGVASPLQRVEEAAERDARLPARDDLDRIGTDDAIGRYQPRNSVAYQAADNAPPTRTRHPDENPVGPDGYEQAAGVA